MISAKKMLYKVVERIATVTVKAKGTIVGYAPSDVTITSGTSWQELCSITLPAGVWMVSICAQFPNNATGARAITLGTATASAGTAIRTMRTQAANGSITTLTLTVPAEGGSTYYLNCYQTSGSSLSVSPRYTAVKIGDSISYA